MQNLAKFVCKKMSILLIVIMVGGLFVGDAFADSSTVLPGWGELCTAENSIVNDTCSKSMYTRCSANGSCHETCTECPTGKVLIESTVPGSTCVSTCGYESVASCNPLTDCGTEPAYYWSFYKTGYQSRTPYNCDVSTDCKWVKGETEYRCAAGYYGTAKCSSSSSCSDCTACPQQHGSSGTVAAGNGTSITDCYKGTSVSSTDASGTYVFTGTCKYTQ